jgi:hypothetical protein
MDHQSDDAQKRGRDCFGQLDKQIKFVRILLGKDTFSNAIASSSVE